MDKWQEPMLCAQFERVLVRVLVWAQWNCWKKLKNVAMQMTAVLEMMMCWKDNRIDQNKELRMTLTHCISCAERVQETMEQQ
jgi:hypothetical protein